MAHVYHLLKWGNAEPNMVFHDEAAALLHNVFFLGVNDVYQPSRWQMVMPPLLSWAAFLSCHGIGGFCLWKIPCLAAAGLCDDLIAQQRSKHARNSFPKGKPALFLLSSPLLLEKKIGVKGQAIGK